MTRLTRLTRLTQLTQLMRLTRLTRLVFAASVAALLLLVLVMSPGVSLAADPAVLQLRTLEPRVYGYQPGDVLQRQLEVDVPAGLLLDTASLPVAGGRGQPIELRALHLHSSPWAGGQRQVLRLDYQVFYAPPEVRTLEIPPFELRYTGGSTAGMQTQTVRVDALPITVAPLLPLLVPQRLGLGDLQPDVPPPLQDETAVRQRLQAWAALAGLLLAWLAWARWGYPWWQRRHLPFGLAWAHLRQLPDAPDVATWQAACGQLHQALNASAGQAIFGHSLAGWAMQQPAFAPLQADLARFLDLSRRAFFAPGAVAGAAVLGEQADGAWLRRLSRRCRDAERG